MLLRAAQTLLSFQCCECLHHVLSFCGALCASSTLVFGLHLPEVRSNRRFSLYTQVHLDSCSPNQRARAQAAKDLRVLMHGLTSAWRIRLSTSLWQDEDNSSESLSFILSAALGFLRRTELVLWSLTSQLPQTWSCPVRMACFSLSLSMLSSLLLREVSCAMENAIRRVPVLACVSSAMAVLQSWQGGQSASLLGLFTSSSQRIIYRQWLPISDLFLHIVFERPRCASRA